MGRDWVLIDAQNAVKSRKIIKNKSMRRLFESTRLVFAELCVLSRVIVVDRFTVPRCRVERYLGYELNVNVLKESATYSARLFFLKTPYRSMKPGIDSVTRFFFSNLLALHYISSPAPYCT